MNFMVLMDWPLDMTTILVGAIAMGIVVDDTLATSFLPLGYGLDHQEQQIQKHLR